MQLNPGTDGRPQHGDAGRIHYLGPLIRARRDRPVRVKFVNQLPAAGPARRPFLPVDTTISGAGTGPLSGDDVYPQNRASLHLHGGLTPWISGGSPYQWVTPAGARTPYRSGPSLVNVPDMWFDEQGRPVGRGYTGATNDPGPGATTLYFPNDQSARFLYLHDDTFGLTRLSVYAGEASPYFVGDAVEDELVATGTLPAAELPLIIEDKTFVPDAEKLRVQDPTWDVARWGGLGALWYPHVYMPNQDAAGAVNAKGRWDYLPWYWKGYEGTENGPVANPLYGSRGDPARAEPGHAQPLGGAERVPRHHARQRDRVPLRQGRAQGLPAAHPERLRRPPAEPAAVLRALRHHRGDRTRRHARAADRLGRGRHAAGGVPGRGRLAGALAHGRTRGRRAGPARHRTGA